MGSIKRNAIPDTLIYLITAALAVGIKLFYNRAEVNELVFILSPVTKIVELFLGESFYFSPEEGFRNTVLGVVIGKSCAGLNYFIIMLLMLVYSFTGLIKSAKGKIAAFIIFSFATFVVTVLVNSFRIITAITFMNFTPMDGETVHRAIGVVFYLFFLMLCYFAVKRIIKGRGGHYEAAS